MTREPTEIELRLIEIFEQERQFWADGIPSYPINFVRRFVAAMSDPSSEMIEAFITMARHRLCNRSLVLDGFRSMLAAACPPEIQTDVVAQPHHTRPMTAAKCLTQDGYVVTRRALTRAEVDQLLKVTADEVGSIVGPETPG